MTKTLKSLIRLQKEEVDEKRRALAGIIARQDALIERKAALRGAMAAEHALVHMEPALAASYGDYVRRVLLEEGALEDMIAALEPEIDVAREAVAESFTVLKRYEIAQQRRVAAEQAAAARRAQRTLDEVALTQYRQRDADDETRTVPRQGKN